MYIATSNENKTISSVKDLKQGQTYFSRKLNQQFIWNKIHEQTREVEIYRNGRLDKMSASKFSKAFLSEGVVAD